MKENNIKDKPYIKGYGHRVAPYIFDKKMGGRAGLADFLKPLDRDACLALFEDYEAMEKTLY